MAYDGIVTRAVVQEIQALEGAKISQINQPVAQDLELVLYHQGQNRRLLLSASANNARMYFVDQARKNPYQAPNFVMLLRKHLQNGVLKQVEQVGLDRVVKLHVQAYDELGFPTTKTLVIEIMGKHSNLILLREDGQVIDAIKRVDADMSRVRQVFAGSQYFSLDDGKENILADYQPPSQLLADLDRPIKVFQFFYRYYTGFSPLISREIVYRAGLDQDLKTDQLTDQDRQALDQSLAYYVDRIRRQAYDFQIFTAYGSYQDFHVFPMDHLGAPALAFDSISSLLERFYRERTLEDKIGQKVGNLQRALKTKLSRDQNKLQAMKEDLAQARDRDQYKVYADLLAANVHRIQPGMEEITLENFYDPDLQPLRIPLNKKIRAWDNTQRYYRRYSKLKSTEKVLRVQIPKLEEEIAYLHQLYTTTTKVTEEEEVDEIRQEMEEAGLLRKRTRKKKQRQAPASQPYHYLTRKGVSVFVGKNNRQNDELTLRKANREDYFFHAKDIPGSHVILRNDQVQEEDIQDAAFLAAYYSSAGGEKVVEVDYTEKKNVNKARGAKPGMVYYENFTTLAVSMDRSVDEFTQVK